MRLMTLGACAVGVVVVLIVVDRMTPREGRAEQPSVNVTQPPAPPTVAPNETARPPVDRPRSEAAPQQERVRDSRSELPDPQRNVAHAPQPAFVFGGVEFLHRFTHQNHHEFTPAGQDDLKSWTEMVTIVQHPNITDPDELGRFANLMLGSYEQLGHIVRAESFSAASNVPAEHLLVGVLGSPEFLEVVFNRFVLHEGVGTVIMFAHREYGHRVGGRMSDWLRANGPTCEERLLQWNDVPKGLTAARAASGKAPK